MQSESVYEGSIFFLYYDSKKAYRNTFEFSLLGDAEPIATGEYHSSQISFIENNKSSYVPLVLIKNFFLSSEPLDMLSPDKMRRSSRGNIRTLGNSGDSLPSLIKLLDSYEMKQLKDEIKKDISSISDVSASVRRPGWAYLETEEEFNKNKIKVSSANISDGTLRLLAIYALRYITKSGGVTLLDEIEDGINIDNLKNVSKFLSSYAEECSQQVIITTHSTIILDYFEPENIRFFHKDDNGNTVCRNFSDSAEIKKQLEFMYPGEIVLNMSNEELKKLFALEDDK